MDPLGINMDARPTQGVMDFYNKVEPWVERIRYDDDDNTLYIFQDNTPEEIFDLLDKVRPELGFDVIIVDE
ncbi:hypothetical protein [Dolosigranulum pigrum]|uniref:Uncharacterized protein n=1 Tax=Dolosigranulum pigrum TaxID=29394 RepID=A0A516GL82_9LACT|nr:hypothetical protein [Dolosigranulum pigrum]QDO92162.1 hypothetical protein FNV33_09215 [Dolosigranulum pigrum]QDO92227.1 hypothetical protein FNV33_09570 [Dolosigranulum pigrum]QDO92292.1 hypothetical protein FNV33_09925 [Dolosigranulum pigrum]QTJ43106.1 hypothetical protein FE327_03835 [Dolosigranulum pigrum]QTJ49895.1 hypothetical protein FE331_04245 [Dolosigranulum pigrum]